MDVVRCLYFDDDPQELERYAGWISRAWDKLELGVRIDVRTAPSTEEAERMLRDPAERFDLFVTDLLVGKKDDSLGLPTLKNAREDYPDLAIVVLSRGDTTHEHDALLAGADAFVPKRLHSRGDPGNFLGEKLLSALRDRGREPISSELEILKFDPDDLPLSSVIETVGRENVVNLTTRTVGHNCTSIHPVFVRAGLSGASVIRVDCEYEVIEGQVKRPESQSWLLKISRSRDSLDAELKKDISEFPEGLFIGFAGTEPKRSGQWHAIATRFRLEAHTLMDWLISQSSGGQIENALSSLFLDPERGLGLVYKRVGRSDKRPNVELWELLTLGRRARIRLAIDELKELCEKYGPETFDTKLIEDFLTAKRIEDLDEESVPGGVSYCLSHGDLHGRNIVVGRSGSASLIDPANVSNLHWAADIARLIVDLIVSAWDYGHKSHEWNFMTEWVEVSRSVLRNNIGAYAGADGEPNERVHAALRWLRYNLFEIHKLQDQALKPEWEFRLALAIEFMRAAYRQQDLTSPKRVLGLISACEALREAAASYREFVAR